MPTIDVYNKNREKVSELNLSDEVFGAPIREDLIHAVVRYQRAKARQGTHKVKGRAEVRGGGRKPWKQKGTGRARQGTIRAPQWRGGGVVHGPTPRSYAFKLNKKVRRAALRGALSQRVSTGAIIVLDELDLPEIKTRQVADLLKTFEVKDALLVLPEKNDNVQLSARNLPNVTTLLVEGVNVRDVLHRGNLILTRAAIEALAQRLGG
ncbi:MAG: 50S ribosomal protein L4 [Deltaproteobacteria bacterium]|nr:MAG: 50S ribosomal protein L4 [Deltaproteobacteria bacterium]